jgi:hypothetical protein
MRSGADRPLEANERTALRDALGDPHIGRLPAALTEIERQVARDDVLLLLVESAAGATRAYFDGFGALLAPVTRPANDPEEPRS